MSNKSQILTLIDESVSAFRNLSQDPNLSGDDRKQITDLLSEMAKKSKCSRLEALQKELYRYVLVSHDPSKAPRQLQCLIAVATVLLAEKTNRPPNAQLLVGDQDSGNVITKLNAAALQAVTTLKKELEASDAARQTAEANEAQAANRLASESSAFLDCSKELDRVNGLLKTREEELAAARAVKVPVSDEAALAMMAEMEVSVVAKDMRITELEKALVEAHANPSGAAAVPAVVSAAPSKEACAQHVQAALSESRQEFRGKLEQIDELLKGVRDGLDTNMPKVMLVGAVDLCIVRVSEMA